VRPELVVEIAFNDLQGPHYSGGLALRFARVKGYRPDKGPEDADTSLRCARFTHDSPAPFSVVPPKPERATHRCRGSRSGFLAMGRDPQADAREDLDLELQLGPI
jgi:hypothetical protein